MKSQPYTRAAALPRILKERIVILDGAMGTMIQRHKLGEADYRGERFKDHPKRPEGQRRPAAADAARGHRDDPRGATCAPAPTSSRPTPSARPRWRRTTTTSAHLAREMNVAGARLAREACAKFTSADKPRFVAGALGPTPKTASISPDVNDPAARNVTFDRAARCLSRAGRGPGRGRLRPAPGRDHLRHAQRQGGAVRHRRADGSKRRAAAGDHLAAPSPTPPAASCRARPCGAFWHSVRHARPLAIGLNCALGAALMRPYVEELARRSPATRSSAATRTPACPIR